MTPTTKIHDTAAEQPGMTDEEIDRRFPPGHPVHARIGRMVSDVYSLWCLCVLSKCRHAGRCRGNPEDCLETFMPLLAPLVVEGGQCHMDAKAAGASFDELYAQYPEQTEALLRWKLAVEQRRGAPRPPAEAAPRLSAAPPSRPCP